MAILQTARATELGLPITQAKSWGVTRAIFYAAAKKGFKKTASRSREQIANKPVEKKKDHYFLGNEMAYTTKMGRRTYFMIGGKLQTESDFERQIARRFGTNFKNAWKESLKIIQEYPKEILLSQNRFFQDIYRPRRDELASKWSEMSELDQKAS
jgi:hypothetical protein